MHTEPESNLENSSCEERNSPLLALDPILISNVFKYMNIGSLIQLNYVCKSFFSYAYLHILSTKHTKVINSFDYGELQYSWSFLLSNFPEKLVHIPFPLLLATKTGNIPFIEKILSRGAFVNATTSQLDSPIHHAAAYGQVEVVKQLIEKGVNIKAANGNKLTALHYATIFNRATVSGILLKEGADINAQSISLRTPLHYAIMNPQSVYESTIDSRRLMMAKRPTTHFSLPVVTYAFEGLFRPHHENLLHLLPILNLTEYEQKKQMTFIIKLLEFGANPKSADIYGELPLHFACLFGSLSLVKFLIPLNDVNHKSHTGYTPLHYAAASGHKEIVVELLKRGTVGSALTRDRSTALSLSLQYNHLSIFTFLASSATMDMDYECQAVVYAEWFPNDYIRHIERTSIVIYIIKKFSEEQVLKYIKLLSRKEMVVIGRSQFADRKITPLHAAVERGFMGVVNLLMTLGADIYAADENGLTCVETALPAHFSEEQKRKFARVLVQHIPDIHKQDSSERTFLFRAVTAKLPYMVGALLGRGAKVYTKCRYDKTAWDVAEDKTMRHMLAVGDIAQHVIDHILNSVYWKL